MSVDAAVATLKNAGFAVTLSKVQGKEPLPSPSEQDEVFTLYCTIAVVLVLIAGLMSGLTLGLMSIDALDLEVLAFPPLLSLTDHSRPPSMRSLAQ